jgi:Flp pilus assembly protein TadD
VLFACGLASKPMVITLPFVLLLLDYWPLERIQGMTPEGEVKQQSVAGLIVEKTPLLLMSAASGVITIVAQRSGGALRSSLEFSFPVRLENAIRACAMYLWNTVWPLKLAPLYPHPGNSLSTLAIAISALTIIGVSMLVARARARRYLLTGWLWFPGTLVPVLGLVQVGDQAMADRYAYIPLIGIFVMIAFGAADVLGSEEKSKRSGSIVAASIGACVLILLLFGTRRQLNYWANNEGLWRHTIAVTEKNFIAEDNLGGALLLNGNSDEAVQHFLIASEINPRDPMSRGNIGAYLLEKGQYGRAIDELKKVPALTSDAGLVASAYANLGTAYRNFGDQFKARQSYEEALRVNPNQSNAWLGMGLLFEEQGNLQQAAMDIARAAEIQADPQTYFLLGRTMARLNRNAEARVAFENALKLQPEFAEAQRALDALGR